ncbi:MAG: trypsin-like peptidase domain-containing protein [Cryobacterium sp.]|nr:trypsin-like peptidase domain-containing protein [Oligoflexia bacterium]
MPRTVSQTESRSPLLLWLIVLLGIFGLGWLSTAKAAGITSSELPDLVEKILPGVANISSTKLNHVMTYGMDQYLQLWGVPKEQPQTSMGSGFIFSKDGYVITNNHVIAEADEVIVTLLDRKSYKARIIGRDDKLDLALLRIRDDKTGAVPPNLHIVTLGDSSKTRIAEPVFAVGNPFGLGHSVTTGIISAKNRTIGIGPLDNFLQTDASINPGNSGGPLFNMKGEVIGINTVIFSKIGQSAGLGFAIPINEAKAVIEDLKKFGRVPRPWLGILGQPISGPLQAYYDLPIDHGILLANLVADAPGETAGLRIGDIITSAEGNEVRENAEVEREIYKKKPGEILTLKVRRNGRDLVLKVKLAELPKLDRLPQGII